MGRVFANGPGDLASIPGRVIPKTLKMVLDTSLLNTRQYKVCIDYSRQLYFYYIHKWKGKIFLWYYNRFFFLIYRNKREFLIINEDNKFRMLQSQRYLHIPLGLGSLPTNLFMFPVNSSIPTCLYLLTGSIIMIFFYSMRVFHTSVITRGWVTASLFRSPGHFPVFKPILTMHWSRWPRSFIWSLMP